MYKLPQKVIGFSFYALFFATPLLFTKINSESFELPKMFFVWAVTSVIVCAWAIRMILEKRIVFRRTLLDLPLLLFLLSQSASYYFSIDHHISFWGDYSRLNGGVLSSITYALLYWAFVSNLNYLHTQSAIRYLLSAAFVVALWGIPTHFGYDPTCVVLFYDSNLSLFDNLRDSLNTSCWRHDFVPTERIFSTLGQPNWLASWLVAVMPLAWSFALMNGILDKWTIRNKIQLSIYPIVYLSMSIMLFFALIYTKSDSGFIGFIIALIIFLLPFILKLIRQNMQRSLSVLTTLVLALIVVTFTFPIAGKFFNPINQCILIISGNANQSSPIANDQITPSSDIRCIVWKGAIDVWKNNPVLGTGPETFSWSYYKYRPPEHNLTSEWNFLYNKAHNEYLNYLANTGILGFSTYLLLPATFIWWSIKNVKCQMLNVKSISKNLKISDISYSFEFCVLSFALLAGYAGLLVTNFFGFSTVSTQLLFFLFPAMAVTAVTRISNKKQEIRTAGLDLSRLLIAISILLLVTYLLSLIVRYFLADIAFQKSENYKDRGGYQQALASIREAIELRPSEPLYWSKLSDTLSSLSILTTDPELILETAKIANETSDSVVATNPVNITFWKTRADVFTRLAGLDQKYEEKARSAYEKVVDLAPTDVNALYDLGFFYWQTGNLSFARRRLVGSIELRPHYRDARFLLANVLWELGEKSAAKEQLAEIIILNPSDEDTKTTLQKWK